jgi:hypothetical protein
MHTMVDHLTVRAQYPALASVSSRIRHGQDRVAIGITNPPSQDRDRITLRCPELGHLEFADLLRLPHFRDHHESLLPALLDEFLNGSIPGVRSCGERS